MFRILVVDDNPTDARLLTENVAGVSRPVAVDWVKDGGQALDFLYKSGNYAQARRPDLILMDLNMPRVGVLEALRAIKGDAALRTIPVIMLSHRSGPVEVRACYEAHANGYVRKPRDGS